MKEKITENLMIEKIAELDKLIEELKYHTKLYDEGHPELTDKEWDDKFFRIVQLEEETGLYRCDSPTQIVSWDVVSALEKVKHNHPMLSLDKTKNINEFKNYFLNIASDKSIIAMPKLDGLTCSLRYVNGHLVGAETRGNGEIGENILHNAKVNSTIPLHISYRDELIVDGEVVCTAENFWKYDEKNGGDYKNPRNFASGKIRSLKANDSCPTDLTFVVWNVIKGFDKENSFCKKLDLVYDLGFFVVPYITSFKGEWIETLKEKANDFGYPIDGLVGRFDDIDFGNSLGTTEHHIKSAYAFKFYDEEYKTNLLDIEWSMGRTGILTPVAIFEPIDIDGTKVERASLHNLNTIEKILETPYIGQQIKVAKMNMIIPQITWGNPFNNDIDEEDKILNSPCFCPICGKDTDIEQSVSGTKNLICTNSQCSGKLINILDHFCGKKGLDIKGLSKMTLEKLINWAWVTNIKDIFNLSKFRDEWINQIGFGPKSVDNILNAIETSRTTTLDKFIAALGIPLIGTTAAKTISKYLEGDTAKFFDYISNDFDFSILDNFGYEMNFSLHSFNYTDAKELFTNGIIKINAPIEEVKTNGFEGLTFVITGKLSKKRDDIKAEIEAKGGKVTGSVSTKTSYLVCNDKNSNTGKSKDAKALGIPIITEEELNNLG